MGTWKLGNAHVDHLDVFVEVTLLREMHRAMAAGVRLFASVGPQVVEVLAHRED